MNRKPLNEVPEQHPVPSEWGSSDQNQLLNASTALGSQSFSFSQKKSRRTYLPDRAMNFDARKPEFTRTPLSLLPINPREDTSPAEETIISHSPPNSWGVYWKRGTKSQYEVQTTQQKRR